jgi:hypothetical protein
MGGTNVILDQTALRDLAQMNDDMGVVSVYATADPRDTSASPAWRLHVGNAIAALRESATADGDRARTAAVLDRLDTLAPELDAVLDTSRSGMGRALFARVGGEDVRTLAVQMPLEDCARLEDRPYLRPLAAALTTDGPAGVLAVSRDGVRVIDLRFGQARELDRLPFELDNDDWRPTRRAATGQGGTLARASGEDDRFERRVEEHLLRFLSSARPRLRATADEHGWSAVVITGGPQLLDVVRQGLDTGSANREIVLLDRVVERMSLSDIAALAGPELRAARVRRCAEAAREARDAALSGGAGAVGVSDTLGALREGRVDHLFLDGAADLRGGRAPDGAYYAQGETAPGVPAAAMVPEADLGERMIAIALTSGADATVLPPDSSDALAEGDGVVARLRW